MEKDLNEELNKIKKEVKEQPEKAQRAIYWFIKNFNHVLEMCKESDMTDEEIEKHMKIAEEKEDYIALALLRVVEVYKHRDAETTEQ